MHHFALIPDADIHEPFGEVGNEVNVDVHMKGHVGYFVLAVGEGNASMAIDHSGVS